MTLSEYLHEFGTRVVELAEQVGVSREYMSAVVHGNKIPGWNLALRVENVTRGRVKATELSHPDNCPHCGQRMNEDG